MNVETGAAAVVTADDFTTLLAEITEVAKGFPAEGKEKPKPDAKDDAAALAAAAAEAEKGKSKPKPAPVDEGDGDEKFTGKSFLVKLADGSEVEAFDGASLFKALTDRAERAETAFGNIWTIVKSLRDQVATLAEAPRGRKTVLSIAEKTVPATELAKAEASGMDSNAFMGKALIANADGRISGHELTKAENAIYKGQQPDADVVRRVLSVA